MNLNLGLRDNGKPFTLPPDAAAQKFALLGVSGSGKTTLGHVMAEEFCKIGQPWIALDPVGVWWGLRAGQDGSPGGYPVVVFGGQHGDLPITKDSGRKIAEALTNEAVFAVIDLKMESKRFWHTFVTDFAMALLELNPREPRHIFIEEAPEFVPQKTRVELTARCKEAVERLVRLGRNNGYGCSLLSQRSATVDKDVLSQCENLFVLRSTGKHDYRALADWLVAAGSEVTEERKYLKHLAKLKDGHGWFWSPHWMGTLERIRVRQKETFHPGATRKVGVEQKTASMANVKEFVDRLKHQLSKVQVSVPSPKSDAGAPSTWDLRPTSRVPREKMTDSAHVGNGERDHEISEIARLRAELETERRLRQDVERRLAAVRATLKPQYEALSGLFKELATSGPSGFGVDRGAYETWLQKAPKRGIRVMLESLIDKGELTFEQLCTLSGAAPSTGYNYVGWLKQNQLIDQNGKSYRLKVV